MESKIEKITELLSGINLLLGYQEKTIQQLEKDVARHDKWIVGCCLICVPCCLFMFVTNVYKMIVG